MKGFSVYHNGKRVCTAAIGKSGVLSAIVNWVGGLHDREEHFHIHVGGLDSSSDEFIDWPTPEIGLGDEITIRILDVDDPDTPSRRRTREEALASG